MGVFIKNPETEARIRELAARTGETLTDAIDRAVTERLAKLGPAQRQGRVDRRKLAEQLTYFGLLTKANEHLTDDDIVGYDDNGLPR